eukprot:TRINITY_DN64037_c0_g1_i1.p1 TRINITY_DN64037_c0_g1~~TRINITY_DN64037_c0_g1_i1.p1  ORF type:complete len:622 (+),score=112.86 TRINITY_DN64037_c0_g1_i1:42-1907(+)
MASGPEVSCGMESDAGESADDRIHLLATAEGSSSRKENSWSRRVILLTVLSVILTVACLGVRSNVEGTQQAEKSSSLTGHLLSRFELVEAWKMLTGGDPFAFKCPLPVIDRMALLSLEGVAASSDCCKSYDILPGLWPYQFPECGHEHCPTCWRYTGQVNLSQNPVRSLAGLGYAAALAVSGPPVMRQSGLHTEEARKLQAHLPAAASSMLRAMDTASSPSTGSPSRDVTRHAGLPYKQIIANAKHGLRERDVNVCPKISDWEQYFLNDDKENVHARVYKSSSARVAVVSFRGTQATSMRNWEIDSDIMMIPMELGKPGPYKVTAPYAANVHQGFYLELQRVLPHVKKWVEGYADGTKGVWGVPADWKLVFTGHSLGAALATLAATLAEAEEWTRKPDAVVAFGSPRLADAALGEWWESRGLCDKMLRVAVYNDVVTWMPLMEPVQVMDSFTYCLQNLQSCFKKLATGPKRLHPSKRWAHVCPSRELVVPGAMKGVNAEMADFSAMGGVLAHFMANSLFGYGHGVLNSDIVNYDSYCGLSEEVFPAATCKALEQLDSVVCFGLERDEVAKTAEQCQQNCCDDSFCSVWQFMKTGQCWRGRSQHCTSAHPYAADVVKGQRVH